MVNGTCHPRILAVCTNCGSAEAAIEFPTGEILPIGQGICRTCGAKDFRDAAETLNH